MPYEKFRSMTDEDRGDRSLPPIAEAGPQSDRDVRDPVSAERVMNGYPRPIVAPVTRIAPRRKNAAPTSANRGVHRLHTPRDDRGRRPGMDFAGGTAHGVRGAEDDLRRQHHAGVNSMPYYTEDLFIEEMRTGKVKARQLDPMSRRRSTAT